MMPANPSELSELIALLRDLAPSVIVMGAAALGYGLGYAAVRG